MKDIQSNQQEKEYSMQYPKVSIIIPYSKDRGWLNEAIESVKNQSYSNIELILSQSNRTVGYNINRGIEKSTGEYVKYLCDDDRLTEWSTQVSVEAMEGNDFIHGNSLVFNDKKTSIYIPDIKYPTLPHMIERNRIHGGTLMYRRDVFDRVGMFDESLDCAEEYEFNLRCLSKGLKLGYCPTFLYEYRRHETQKSIGNLSEEYQEVRRKKIQLIKDKYESSNRPSPSRT